jgi:hypothetical protein
MVNSKFARGVQILSAHLNPDDYNLVTEHDQLWFGAPKLTDAEREELLSLGWFFDEDVEAWSCFA